MFAVVRSTQSADNSSAYFACSAVEEFLTAETAKTAKEEGRNEERKVKREQRTKARKLRAAYKASRDLHAFFILLLSFFFCTADNHNQF
jgi:hypothetical protein